MPIHEESGPIPPNRFYRKRLSCFVRCGSRAPPREVENKRIVYALRSGKPAAAYVVERVFFAGSQKKPLTNTLLITTDFTLIKIREIRDTLLDQILFLTRPNPTRLRSLSNDLELKL